MIYKIRMNKNDFFKLHNRISAKNVSIDGEMVEFNVELGSYNIVKESGYHYNVESSLSIKFKSFMKKYYLLLMGILYLFAILYINSYRVKDILFNINTPINEKIDIKIRQTFKHFLFYDFCSIDYNTLAMEIRNEYIEYPFIDIYEKNNNIYVEIYSYNENYPYDTKGVEGNIVAKKDGIIESFYIASGQGEISKNKYVKKGDILVTGNPIVKGTVYAYTFDKVTIEINKNTTITVKTGNFDKYSELEIFGFTFNINKKCNYLLSDISYKTKFNLFDIFYIKEIVEEEKNDIIKTYNEEDAKILAINTIQDSFYNNIKSDKEKIIDIYVYNVSEYDTSYSITLITKKLESIGYVL